MLSRVVALGLLIVAIALLISAWANSQPLVQQSATPSWLVFPTVAAAQARSAAECKARGCGPGTLYWWHVEPNPQTGEGAIRLEPAQRSHDNDYSAGKMTPTERSAIISHETLLAKPGWDKAR